MLIIELVSIGRAMAPCGIRGDLGPSMARIDLCGGRLELVSRRSFAILLTALAVSAMASAAEWTVQTLDSQGCTGYWTSIDVDSQGYVHIVYRDDTDNRLVHIYQGGRTSSLPPTVRPTSSGTKQTTWTCATP